MARIQFRVTFPDGEVIEGTSDLSGDEFVQFVSGNLHDSDQAFIEIRQAS